MFTSIFMSEKDKQQAKIDQVFTEDCKSVNIEYLQSVISESGAVLDKLEPKHLLQFITAINNLLQLKLTGDHVVTLYGQRLELTFNNKSNLKNITLI